MEDLFMGHEDTPSVRVEVGDTQSGLSDATPAVLDQRRRTVALLGGLLVLVLVIVVILAIRPSSDEVAGGSPRATTPPPTTTTTTTTSVAASAEMQEPAVSPHRRIEGLPGTDFSAIAPAGMGYLATVWNINSDASTLLYRSLDGVRWSPVLARFPLALEQSHESGNLSLSHLRQTADGFAMIAWTSPNSDVSGAPTLRRLVSSDGIDWTVQTEVGAASDNLYAYPLFHSDSLWAYASIAAETTPVRRLLETNLRDGVQFDEEPCWTESPNGETVNVYGCDGSGPVVLEAEDFIDGVEPRMVVRCSNSLYGVGVLHVEVLNNSTGATVRTIAMPESVNIAVGSEDGDPIVGVDTRFYFPEETSSCEGLIEVPAPPDLPVMIWDSTSERADRVGFPQAGSSDQSLSWVPIFVRDSSMMTVVRGQIWELEFDVLEWSEGPLLSSASDHGSYHLAQDGRTLISSDGSSVMAVTDLDTFETRTIETELARQLNWIIYADSEVAIVHSSSATYRIDLTAE